MATTEKLNLWDRIFNRYRKEVMEEGTEIWDRYPYGMRIESCKIGTLRSFVKYKIIDRVTGSETIKIEYLN